MENALSHPSMDSEDSIDSEVLIEIHNVSKHYPIWSSQGHQLLALLLTGLRKIFPPSSFLERWHWARFCRVFKALDEVSFQIRRGESVGIIGRNGSGKSTLLQIIAGTRLPTSGEVRVRGRIAALLELGSGFKPEFTGRENVYVNGAILGLSRKEVEKKFSEIEAFAEIGDFIDRPIKTYSSGMLVRLVFAVQVALEPDVLIIDEALAVGDVFFQQKCARKMRELKEKGTTLLFVSHNMQDIRSLCEKALLLQNGILKYAGPAIEASQHYFNPTQGDAGESTLSKKELADREARNIMTPLWTVPDNHDTSSLTITAVGVHGAKAWSDVEVLIGEEVKFVVELASYVEGIQEYWVSVSIKNSRDLLVNATTSPGSTPFRIALAERKLIQVNVRFSVEPGPYTISFSLGRPEYPNGWTPVDGTTWMGPVLVGWPFSTAPAPFHGAFGLPVSMEEISATQ